MKTFMVIHYTIAMQETIKICPNCEAEFFAHIERCNVCEVALTTPEAYAEVKDAVTKGHHIEKEAFGDAAPRIVRELTGTLACVETGKLSYLSAIAPILTKADIAYEIVEAEGADAGSSCGKKTLGDLPSEIVVELADEDAALRAIEEHMHTVFPDMKESKDLLGSGQCPACTSPTGGADECPDCGLNLSGMGSGDDCSTC